VAGAKLKAPRGTFDVLPEDAYKRRELHRRVWAVLGRGGYRPFEAPVFESTELFKRGVGDSTDIVQKEMFTFDDQGGRSLTLRPEGTAPVCRAYVEHGMHKLPQPVKLWYWGPFFRHERAQAGRYRQFNQVGLEALGSDDPSLDAEAVLLLAEVLEAAVVKGARLKLSSLGTRESREAYLAELQGYLREHEAQLSDDVRARIDQNPLRAFDADHEGTRRVMAGAPRLLDRLSAEDAEHFAEVRQLLDSAGLGYEVDTTLVRGLDYYTRTVFEFESDRLGAQRGVGGGGRYDGLVEALGGPRTPGVGWGAGIERILLASESKFPLPPRPIYVAFGDAERRAEAFALVTALREAGVRSEVEQAGRSLKGQLRHADRISARGVFIVGEEIEWKSMENGEQRSVTGVQEAVRIAAGVIT
jgi:histidyl-tRNA synthetase